MSDHFVDVTNMVSDTPRTDAAYFEPGATMYDLAGEAKRMERELNAANQMFKKLNIHTLNLTDRIKRLEDRIERASAAFFTDGSDRQAAGAMLAILEEERVLAILEEERSKP